MKFLFALSLLLFVIPAGAQQIPQPKPTARDVYVGCSLLVHDTDVLNNEENRAQPYSAAICSLYGLLAIRDRESWVEGKDNKYRFCLPKTAEASQNPARAMAYAYIDFFEAGGAAMADRPGNEAFVAAMIMKWPCNAQNR